MIIDQYKSDIRLLRESSVINAYEATKLQILLILSTTRRKTMMTVEELLKQKHFIGL